MSYTPDALPSALNAALLLSDGTVFWGRGFGAEETVMGEICFNTAMTGYQEVLSDPSYQGQLITFTFPHIGNVGCNVEDVESHASPRVGAGGLIVREAVTSHSNFRATEPLEDWLRERGIAGISGVDTRALTRHIRAHGAQNAMILRVLNTALDAQMKKANKQLSRHPLLGGMELARVVTAKTCYGWDEPRWALAENPVVAHGHRAHVVAIDYGNKHNIPRSLTSAGCRVTIVPAETSAETILALAPEGIFLSNGPGDPAATGIYAVPVIQALISADIPIFGICLGHQMLALALGGKTEKMRQGHRGANHPVKNLRSGKVEITSQNHGFVVEESSLPAGVEVTHRSLFDGSVEGLRLKGKSVFSVQYHPESSPGPHDSLYLFEEFVEMMQARPASTMEA